jgi:hypothetical protein
MLEMWLSVTRVLTFLENLSVTWSLFDALPSWPSTFVIIASRTVYLMSLKSTWDFFYTSEFLNLKLFSLLFIIGVFALSGFDIMLSF